MGREDDVTSNDEVKYLFNDTFPHILSLNLKQCKLLDVLEIGSVKDRVGTNTVVFNLK